MEEVTLMCALLWERGVDVFPVVIGKSKVAGLFKKAIKAEKPNDLKDFDADKLRLFLAKMGDAWLPDDDSLQAVLQDRDFSSYLEIRLSWKLDKPSLFGPNVSLEEDVIHVLVVVPEQVSTPSVPLAVPIGPEVNLRSCDDLFAFLESEMTNKEAILSQPHILAPESLQFRLVGRKQAIDTASTCFQNIIAHAEISAYDRTEVPIPVCSGISGLGKTRMLEEGSTILHEMKLDPKYVFRVVVPYSIGFSPQPVEQSMPIQAPLAWRLLYRFFLDNNCLYSFQAWFKSRLPISGGQLTIEDAVKAIERKLREKFAEPVPLYLFLGVDEYQKIYLIGAQQSCSSKTSTLRELVENITALLLSQSVSMVLLPMFAGTDLDVIESSSIANSSFYVTRRLPMTLLSMDQVFSTVDGNAHYAGLLKHTQICRYLFALGGVPRWFVDYLKEVKKMCLQGETATLKNIEDCFLTTWFSYVNSYLKSLDIRQRVRLAAFAVSGRKVEESQPFDELLKWSRLRDSSICLLIPSTSGSCDVRVPYALLQKIGERCGDMTNDAEKSFAMALKDMWEMVDSKMFDLQPWQAWEMFGACFYAVRINALLVLGHSNVTLRGLLPGTRMSSETESISVKLAPSRVFWCAESFGSLTPPLISRQGNQLEKVDWTTSGCIAVNGDGGAGVDIFFALRDAVTDNLVVFLDQRKRHFGKFQPSHAADHRVHKVSKKTTRPRPIGVPPP